MEKPILDKANYLHPCTNSIGKWTEYEDEMILRYVHSIDHSKPKNWLVLAEKLGNRQSKQLRERWFNHINPIIKKTEWTQEEQWVLFICKYKFKLSWSQLPKVLFGRTDNDAKNYCNSKLSKTAKYMEKPL